MGIWTKGRTYEETNRVSDGRTELGRTELSETEGQTVGWRDEQTIVWRGE